MLEKKKHVKRVSKSGVGAEREKGVKTRKIGGKVIQITLISILAMRSNVERVGKALVTTIF